MAGKSRPDPLGAAFDEIRFGQKGTLNLRDGLPSAAEAVARAETFLREHQLRGTPEVLIITGRGNQSIGGVAVIRDAIERLLFSLRRRGIIESHHAHNPGAFAVRLATIRSVVEAPPRRREPPSPRPRAAIEGLSAESVQLLRELAECSLDALGVTQNESNVVNEMHRQLRSILPGVPGGEKMEEQLRAALRVAIAEYD